MYQRSATPYRLEHHVVHSGQQQSPRRGGDLPPPPAAPPGGGGGGGGLDEELFLRGNAEGGGEVTQGGHVQLGGGVVEESMEGRDRSLVEYYCK